MERYIGILGIFTILAIAYLLSNNRKKIDKKIIFWGLSLQMFFAVLILKVPGGKWVFDRIDTFIKKILDFSVEGSKFLFGNLANSDLYFPQDGSWPGFGFQFAFLVSPTVIFFSSIMSVLYHFGVMQKIIKFIEDELHHKDIADDEGATKKGLYSILDSIIKTGSKIAINISEKI